MATGERDRWKEKKAHLTCPPCQVARWKRVKEGVTRMARTTQDIALEVTGAFKSVETLVATVLGPHLLRRKNEE